MTNQFRTYLVNVEEDQLRFLRELVLQPSYSYNKEDVDKAGELIRKALTSLPLSVETVEQTETGNHLIFRTPACQDHEKSILLVGHMDTVFPVDSGFNWYKDDGEKIFGPGVIDMKGGLVVAIYALKALHDRGLLEQIPISLICNSDEEIGSPTSRDLFVSEAGKGLFGLVFECGGLNGEIVTGRKGKGGFTLKVHGKAGHAAFAGRDKASAILALAQKIIRLEQLNNPEKQLVVNVGTIQGGIGPNTIPEHAEVQIDSRFLTLDDARVVETALRDITLHQDIPGTTAKLIKTSGRDPMEQSVQNRNLFHFIQQQAEKLQISVKEELRSGVSDANTLVASGLPVVDGMGPVGDCDHSDREYMIKKSLVEKTVLTATVIHELWENSKQV